jgi:peptide/nickel transport system substrate-binding protein
MANIRYILRLIAAFFGRFKVLILLSIIFGAGAFFVLRFVIPSFLGGTSVSIGITGRYTAGTLPDYILEMIGDGLTKIDSAGNVDPNLAASWETPDKGKTWIFKLKKGVSWQDGKPVSAESVSYQFSDVTGSSPDDYTLVFELQNPYSAFPTVVSKPVFKKGLLGTGEWKVKKLSLSGSFVSQITLENSKGERIVYKFYPTEERTKLAFQLGEVNRIEGILNSNPFNSWSKVKIGKNIESGEYVGIFLNTNDKLLSEKNLRQALSYAINKDNLPGKRAISPISETSWAYNPQVKPYNYDAGKAREMIGNLPDDTLAALSINLTTSPVLLDTAEKIAKDWEAVGVKTNIQVTAGVPSDYQAFLVIFDIPSDPDQYSIWHSTQSGSSIVKYQNPRIDKLLEDGRTQLNSEDRKKTYLDFQRFLIEDSPAIFLYYPETFTISRE